jgi:hypothetical protein
LFCRALRNLRGDTLANQELVIFIANQNLELEKARAKKKDSSDHFEIEMKQPTRKVPKVFDRELELDFMIWKMDVEIQFEYNNNCSRMRRIRSCG